MTEKRNETKHTNERTKRKTRNVFRRLFQNSITFYQIRNHLLKTEKKRKITVTLKQTTKIELYIYVVSNTKFCN